MIKNRMQNFEKNLIGYWKHTDRHYLGEWVVLGAVLLFCFLTMCYSDILYTNHDAYRFWNYIFSGKILRLNNAFVACPYGISYVFVFSLGFLPMWIIGQLGSNYRISCMCLVDESISSLFDDNYVVRGSKNCVSGWYK